MNRNGTEGPLPLAMALTAEFTEESPFGRSELLVSKDTTDG